jgi:predicted DNA-binding transcriptional regulator YafY
MDTPEARSSEKTSVDLLLHERKRDGAELLSLKEVAQNGKASTEVYNEEWLVRAILSSSPSIEVTAPAGVRSQVANEAKKILALYLS